MNPEIESEILDAVGRCQFDPQAWSLFAWDWGHGELKDFDGPREWQRETNELIRDHLSNPETRFQPLQIAVSSGHGVGKILSNIIHLDTPSGKRQWGDISVGDALFGSDGKQTVVSNKYEYDNWDFYRITFSDGTATFAGKEHQWFATTRLQRARGLSGCVVTTEEMMTHPKRFYQIPLTRPVEYPEMGNALHPYLLGYILGNGGLRTASAVRIACHDTELYAHMQALMPESCRFRGRSKNYLHISADGAEGHNIILNELRRVGLHGSGSLDKWIPDFYKYNSARNRIELLRGLMDSDGTISPRKGDNGRAGYKVQYSTSSPRLRDDMIWLVRSLGGVSNYSTDRRRGGMATSDNYEVHINLPSYINPFFLRRKREMYDEYVATVKREPIKVVRSIEYDHTGPGHCVTVTAPDRLYLANDFIVTHNSAAIGMLTQWAMSCFDDARVTVTANTETQLRTKTVPEVRKWFRSALNGHWFDPQATTIKSMDPDHKESWRVDFIPWSEHNTEAFAGLHNQGRIIILVFDESSKIADKVWEVAEGALTDENTIIIWLAFGNPTRNTGRFRECFRRFRHRWVTKQIDSRTVPGTNKKKIAEWQADHGEDSDFFKVRVRGQFPAQSAMQFIGTEDADHARHAMLGLKKPMFDFAPTIIGLDPAWTGEDTLEVFLRQGLYSKHLRTVARNDNDVQMANMLALLEDEYKADAVFVDAGYGTGIVSAGKVLGRNWQLIWFSEKPDNPGYLNKRAEMWGLMKQWLKEGGAIEPNDEVLYQDLLGLETVPRLDGKILLESKEDMKARGIPSPNRADALALTFARPVAAKARALAPIMRPSKPYDPFSEFTR